MSVHFEDQLFNIVYKIMVVYSENHMKHMNIG
jgi:hypothetical protein